MIIIYFVWPKDAGVTRTQHVGRNVTGEICDSLSVVGRVGHVSSELDFSSWVSDGPGGGRAGHVSCERAPYDWFSDKPRDRASED